MIMVRRAEIPQFGLLSGVKVVHNTVSIAGPFAAELYAEYGADVIWIENAKVPCMSRVATGNAWQQDRRNQRNLSIDISLPEGKEIFLKLMEETDVFISAARGGQYEKMGLGDEVLWERNPRLVIVKISGFGQTGRPDYMNRPSYDPIAQAFGGYMAMNGFPGMPSMPTNPLTADYMSALFAFGTSVAAVMKSRETGRGESIDLAQYEVLMRTQSRYPMDFLEQGIPFVKEGSHSAYFAGYGAYSCQDEKEVYMLYLGAGVLKRGLPFMGVEFGTEKIPSSTNLLYLSSPEGQLLEEKIKAFCQSHTAEEVEKAFLAHGVPCSRIMDYNDCLKDPQYVAREVFTEWKKVNGESVKGVNIFPKFKNHPAQIWRGAPNIGMDNEDILGELGLTEEQIKELYRKKILAQRDYLNNI
ncbi:L-carnitine CoA-transferase [Desulfitobacterium chlororespirans]|nr:L-carnitine CoA-transferase [Desulfitobacterium chlororespirans]